MDHQIRHLSTYSYEPDAQSVSLRLKLFPPDFEGQTVENWRVTVNGEDVSPLVNTGVGDAEALWSQMEPTGQIEIVATGKVVTTDTTGIVRGLPGEAMPDIYCRATPLTKPDKAIRALGKEFHSDEDTLASLHALMAAINERVTYKAGTTDQGTTAAEALARGEGVCQDHAQIFIAAARSMNLPARYVTGYLQADGGGNAASVEPAEDETEASSQSQSQSAAPPVPGDATPELQEEPSQFQSQSQGAEQLLETHAWAEVFVEGIGWVGFDPSNDICPTEHYVRLCSGQDAFDASPIRGNVIGETSESLEVSVAIGHAQQ